MLVVLGTTDASMHRCYHVCYIASSCYVSTGLLYHATNSRDVPWYLASCWHDSTTRKQKAQNPASKKRCTARSSAGEGRRAKKATVSGLGLGILQSRGHSDFKKSLLQELVAKIQVPSARDYFLSSSRGRHPATLKHCNTLKPL